MSRQNKHPEIVKIKDILNKILNLPNELSHELAEYCCNLDMILEYVINDLANNKINIYTEGEDLSINFGDRNEYIYLESNKICNHIYNCTGTYRVTIKGKMYKFGIDDM